ncbi:hypothetical protein EXT47_07855 [Pseudoalteromonas sp. CO342X]|nr:hypothetical protein EXT47_07855 [Pseudoalteromonas sp. CO342X]
MEVNSTQLALKLAARKALIIRSSGYLSNQSFRITTCSLAAVIPYYCVKFACNRPAIDAQICLVLRNKLWLE